MARRKKTAVPEMNTEELPDLTPQQYLFVQSILDGKSLADSYRHAYPGSAADTTIWAHASRLARNGKVATWIAEARKAAGQRAVITLEDHIAELNRLKEIALETGNVGAAVAAENYKGKATGLYVERTQDMTPKVSADDLIKAILGEGASAALASDLGVPENIVAQALTRLLMGNERASQ